MGRLPFRACLLACIAVLPATAAHASCWQAQEAKAAQLRSLDALLMMGAQRCASSEPALAERYDAFASQHRATLDTQGLVLKARFMREAGIAGGQKAYDDFLASLQDAQSARLGDAGLCSTVGDLTKLATEGSAADLETLAASFASDAVAADQRCVAETTAGAAPAPTEEMPVVQGGIPQGDPAKPAAPTQQEAMAQAAAALQTATEALKSVQAERAAGPKVVEPAPEQEQPAASEAQPEYVPN